MSNMVQELRKLAADGQVACYGLVGFAKKECNDFKNCGECNAAVVRSLADRIEAEYDPKPEPDTLEKVAREMIETITTSYSIGIPPSIQMVTDFTIRLEALGVTFDE